MVRLARAAVPADFVPGKFSEKPRQFIEKPREFIEFYGNSISLSEAIGAAIIPAFSSSPDTAIAGDCGPDESPGPGGKWLPGALQSEE